MNRNAFLRQTKSSESEDQSAPTKFESMCLKMPTTGGALPFQKSLRVINPMLPPVERLKSHVPDYCREYRKHQRARKHKHGRTFLGRSILLKPFETAICFFVESRALLTLGLLNKRDFPISRRRLWPANFIRYNNQHDVYQDNPRFDLKDYPVPERTFTRDSLGKMENPAEHKKSQGCVETAWLPRISKFPVEAVLI